MLEVWMGWRSRGGVGKRMIVLGVGGSFCQYATIISCRATLANCQPSLISLLGDVLAVMQLDKFANIPGNRSKYNKSELNGSLEELNSSQFTTKSDDGLANNENNMEVIWIGWGKIL